MDRKGPLVSGVSGKTKSFLKEKHYQNFVFTWHRWHPLEEYVLIFTFAHILFVPTVPNPSVVRMGRTPRARYIYLGFDSEVGWGLLTSIMLLIYRGWSKTSE